MSLLSVGAVRPPTYPARPINGGGLELAPPKPGQWRYEPKYNGWRALVHAPTGSMFNRYGQPLSIAAEFGRALKHQGTQQQQIFDAPFHWSIPFDYQSHAHAAPLERLTEGSPIGACSWLVHRIGCSYFHLCSLDDLFRGGAKRPPVTTCPAKGSSGETAITETSSSPK